MIPEINQKNYYTPELSKQFQSVSQFKNFLECPARTMAELSGEFTRESNTAMLIGSYVDAWCEGTLEQFKSDHPEIFLKNGGLKADFVQADAIIQRISADPEFMRYLDGEKQVIFTGEIENVPFKGKLDSYHAGKCIVDLKVMRDFEPIWKNGRKRHFIEAWGYDIQGAVYQELVFQATGEKLPFVICAVTKEKVPDLAILEIPQERLDACLALVKSRAPEFQKIKNGEIPPERCESCDFCKMTKKLSGAINYMDMFPELYRYRDQTRSQDQSQPVSVAEIMKIPETPDFREITGDSGNPEKKHKKKHRKSKKAKKFKKIVIKI